MNAAYKVERIRPAVEQLGSWTVDSRAQDLPESAGGNCPFCHHRCDVAIDTVITTLGFASGSGNTPEPPEKLTRLISCVCGDDHPKRPTGVPQGCGRWWLAELVKHESGGVISYTVQPASDDSMLPAAQQIKASLSTQTADVGAAAEKWLAGVAALYGVFGLTGIAVGKDSLAGFGGGTKLGIGLAVLVGVVAAALAIFFSYRAAYGWPKTVQIGSDGQQKKWYADTKENTVKAAEYLQNGVIAAGVALAALVVATSVIWFAPAKDAPAPTVTVAGTDGSMTCGVLLSSDSSGAVRVRNGDGEVVSRAAGDVAKVTVGACPS